MKYVRCYDNGGVDEGGTIDKQPIVIMGSKYVLTNSKPGHITVGCETHDFAWWKKNGVKLAKDQGFTAEEIKEYKAYFALMFKMAK